MEKVLAEKGVLRTVSSAASLGGGDDKGRGLSPEGRELLEDSVERNNVPLISEETLGESIRRRMEIYDDIAGGRRIGAYINVGGGLASLGSSQNGKLIPAGLSKNLGMKNFPRKGVTILMSERGIPVIHLLDVIDIAEQYGFRVAPVPLPQPGEGLVFEREKYNVVTSLLVLIAYAVIIAVFVRLDIRHYLFRRRGIAADSK
jgi:poly-gamma-glutamate system protein